MKTTKILTTQEIALQLWKLSYPIMIAIAMQTMYDLADMAWLGHLSETALSGTTLFGTIFMLFSVLNEVTGSGSVSMLSQNFGRGDVDTTRRIAEQTISFKALLAVLTALFIAIFLLPLLHFYTDDRAVIRAALDYGWLRLFFIRRLFMSYSVNTIFRCNGDSKTPMKIMIFSGILNIVLDPVFIFETIPGTRIAGLNLGVFGASLVTVMTSTLSFLIGFILLVRGKSAVQISIKGLFRLDRAIDIGLLKIGLPAGFDLLLRRFFMAILIKFVASYGSWAIALAGIGGRLSMFAFMPIFGFGMGGSSLVGQSLGSEKIQQAETVARLSVAMSFAIVSISVVLGLLFPGQILSLFITDLTTLDQGITMLRLFLISFLPMTIGMSLNVVFMGSGHNSPKLYATAISRWLVQLPMLLICVSFLKLALTVVWSSFIVAEFAELATIFYHYKKGLWKNKRV